MRPPPAEPVEARACRLGLCNPGKGLAIGQDLGYGVPVGGFGIDPNQRLSARKAYQQSTAVVHDKLVAVGRDQLRYRHPGHRALDEHR